MDVRNIEKETEIGYQDVNRKGDQNERRPQILVILVAQENNNKKKLLKRR